MAEVQEEICVTDKQLTSTVTREQDPTCAVAADDSTLLMDLDEANNSGNNHLDGNLESSQTLIADPQTFHDIDSSSGDALSRSELVTNVADGTDGVFEDEWDDFVDTPAKDVALEFSGAVADDINVTETMQIESTPGGHELSPAEAAGDDAIVNHGLRSTAANISADSHVAGSQSTSEHDWVEFNGPVSNFAEVFTDLDPVVDPGDRNAGFDLSNAVESTFSGIHSDNQHSASEEGLGELDRVIANAIEPATAIDSTINESVPGEVVDADSPAEEDWGDFNEVHEKNVETAAADEEWGDFGDVRGNNVETAEENWGDFNDVQGSNVENAAAREGWDDFNEAIAEDVVSTNNDRSQAVVAGNDAGHTNLHSINQTTSSSTFEADDWGDFNDAAVSLNAAESTTNGMQSHASFEEDWGEFNDVVASETDPNVAQPNVAQNEMDGGWKGVPSPQENFGAQVGFEFKFPAQPAAESREVRNRFICNVFLMNLSQNVLTTFLSCCIGYFGTDRQSQTDENDIFHSGNSDAVTGIITTKNSFGSSNWCRSVALQWLLDSQPPDLLPHVSLIALHGLQPANGAAGVAAVAPPQSPFGRAPLRGDIPESIMLSEELEFLSLGSNMGQASKAGTGAVAKPQKAVTETLPTTQTKEKSKPNLATATKSESQPAAEMKMSPCMQYLVSIPDLSYVSEI